AHRAPSNRSAAAFAVVELTHIRSLPSVPPSAWESMATPVVRSQTVSIGELLRSGAFVPARVQRAYCWTEEQQQSLLEDLLAAFYGRSPPWGDSRASQSVRSPASRRGALFG